MLALLFVLPGLAWGPVLAPGSGSPLVIAGRAAGASLLVTSLTCTGLAALGSLTTGPLLAALTVLTCVPFALSSRRRALGRALRRLPGALRGRRGRWLVGALAGAGLAVLLVVLPSRSAVGDALLPFSSTVWYYANLARAVALEGGFPSAMPEWGALRPFQTDYLPVTAHTAAAFVLLPTDMRLVLEVYRIALLAAAIAVAALLLRRFVSSWLALLGACLLLATVRLETKFLAYRPETWALVVALFVLWLADRAVVERSRRLAASAAIGAGVTLLAHAEVFLLLGPGLAGIAVARLLVNGRGRLGLRRPGRRAAYRAAGVPVLILVGGLALGVVASAGLTGAVRIVGYAAGTGDAAARPPAADIPPGWTFTDDPTWDFYVAAAAPASMGTNAPTRFLDSRLMPRSILLVWPGLDGRAPVQLIVLVALVGLPIVAWPLLDARRRRLLLVALVVGAGLVVGSYLLFAISHTYVPMRTGPRRLMPYLLLVPVLAGVIGLWATDRVLRPGWRALLPRRGAMLAAGLALAVLAGGAISRPPVAEADPDAEPGLTAVGYDAYRWAAENLPPDARILANAYTDGSLAALAERVGIVDGRAVYLENAAFLGQSTALVLGARTLFLDPNGEAATRYLDRNRVDYLLVADVAAGAGAADLGGYDPFPADMAALRGGGRYTLVRSFAGGRLLLFEVRPA